MSDKATRTVRICRQGECGGECYRCRLTRCHRELEAVRAMAIHLYDAGIVAGTHGPWSDNRTDDERRLWSLFDEFRDGKVWLTELPAEEMTE